MNGGDFCCFTKKARGVFVHHHKPFYASPEDGDYEQFSNNAPSAVPSLFFPGSMW